MKKLVSLLLVLCMILSVVPAMAATIQIESNEHYLDEPIALSHGLTGTDNGYAGGYSGNTVSFVLTNGTAVANALGITIEKGLKLSAYGTDGDFDGLVVNGDINYKGTGAVTDASGNLTYEEDGTTVKMEAFEYNYKLIDAPVIGIRANGAGTALVIDINPNDYYDETGTTKIGATRRVNATKGDLWTEKLTNGVLSNKSQSKGPKYETGKFPEGTIFISVTEFENGPDSTWPGILADDKFTSQVYKLWDENNAVAKTGVGPSAHFKSKVAGKYDIWVMRADLDKSNDTTRAAKFYIDDTLYTSNQRPDDFADTNTDRFFFWSKQGSSITLEEYATFKVQLAAQNDQYCRLAMIALVPSSAEIDLPLTSADIYSGDTAISQDTAVTLREFYLDKVDATLSTDAVKATVNGTEYDVTASLVRRDVFGDVITAPTVYDAILKAGLTAKADGATADYITVNGKEIVNADKIKLNAGDTIVVADAKVDAFSPVAISHLYNTCGGGFKFCFNAAGLHDTHLKFALAYAEDGSYTEIESDTDGLIGSYVAGYSYNTVDDTQNNITVPKGSKQIFTSPKKHLLNKYNDSSALDKNAGRVDINTSNISFGDHPIIASPEDPAVGLWKPYTTGQWPETDKSNLYLLDSATTFDVTVARNGARFAIQTDAAETIKLITINYDNAGNILSTKVSEDIVITVITPYVGTVYDNQKILVWRSEPYAGNVATAGTTMVPLCAPITK